MKNLNKTGEIYHESYTGPRDKYLFRFERKRKGLFYCILKPFSITLNESGSGPVFSFIGCNERYDIRSNFGTYYSVDKFGRRIDDIKWREARKKLLYISITLPLCYIKERGINGEKVKKRFRFVKNFYL